MSTFHLIIYFSHLSEGKLLLHMHLTKYKGKEWSQVEVLQLKLGMIMVEMMKRVLGTVCILYFILVHFLRVFA